MHAGNKEDRGCCLTGALLLSSSSSSGCLDERYTPCPLSKERASSPLALSPDLLRRRWTPIHRGSFPSVSGHPCRSAVKSPVHYPYYCVCACAFGKTKTRTGTTDSLTVQVWRRGRVRVHVRFVRAVQEDESSSAANNPVPPNRSSSPPPAHTRCCFSSSQTTCNRISFKIMLRVHKPSLKARFLLKNKV